MVQLLLSPGTQNNWRKLHYGISGFGFFLKACSKIVYVHVKIWSVHSDFFAVPSLFPHLICWMPPLWKFLYTECIKAQSHQLLFHIFAIQKDPAVVHWFDICQKIQVSKRSSDVLLTEDIKWKIQGGHLICKYSQCT